MKKIVVFVLAALSLAIFAAPVMAQDGDRARALLEEQDDLYRSKSSRVKMTMKVKTEHYERSMTMESWSKGKKKSLVRIESPRKEKGTATLMLDQSIYTYLPKTDRTIRISSAMMGGSWMGSHFTNDDLVKQSRMADDYTYKITFEGARGGQDVIEITLMPKEDAAVSWGKIVVEIRAADKMPTWQKFYDEDGVVARTMTFSDFKTFGGRTMPATMKIIPADKPGEYTEVTYEEAEFDLKVSDKLFSLNSLKR